MIGMDMKVFSEETRKRIEQSQKEIAEGKVVSLEEIKVRLGIYDD